MSREQIEDREYYKCCLHVSERKYIKQTEPYLQSIPEQRDK